MKLGIERHDRYAGSRAGQIHIHPLRAVLKYLRHILFARLQTELRAIGLSRLPHLCKELPVCALLPLLILTEHMGNMLWILFCESFKC